MKVRELIAKLSTLPPDAEIYTFSHSEDTDVYAPTHNAQVVTLYETCRESRYYAARPGWWNGKQIRAIVIH